MYRIGWFTTGRDQAAIDLLQTVIKEIVTGAIKAEISFVFCSREPGESPESDRIIQMAQEQGIPTVYFSYQQFKARQKSADKKGTALPLWRDDYDREVMRRLEPFHTDICVMAGYMLIVSKEMCRRYNLINLHPAVPGGPTGTWQEVIWKLIEGKARSTGAMMHLVTPELDRGPAVTYFTFSIRGEPFDRYWEEIEDHSIPQIKEKEGENNRLFRLIRQYGLAREFPLIVTTIKAFSENKVRVTADKKIVDAQGNLINGYDLTREIDKVLK